MLSRKDKRRRHLSKPPVLEIAFRVSEQNLTFAMIGGCPRLPTPLRPLNAKCAEGFEIRLDLLVYQPRHVFLFVHSNPPMVVLYAIQ